MYFFDHFEEVAKRYRHQRLWLVAFLSRREWITGGLLIEQKMLFLVSKCKKHQMSTFLQIDTLYILVFSGQRCVNS